MIYVINERGGSISRARKLHVRLEDPQTSPVNNGILARALKMTRIPTNGNKDRKTLGWSAPAYP